MGCAAQRRIAVRGALGARCDAIRQCLRDQLRAIREEGVEKLGNHPCVFTEIGIPFDMDSKNAYKTGDYSSQVSAMDANHHALEGSGAAGFTLWTYAALVRSLTNLLHPTKLIPPEQP